jgi:hypothetical protein
MWHRFKRWVGRVTRDEAGQSIFIIAAAFVALLVIIGLAIDLGLMYIERIKLGRACDAAALAAAQDLPFEEFAARRAIQYLTENGYDPNNTELIVLGPENAATLSWTAPPDSRGTITIDMESYEDSEIKVQSEKDNSADKIRVHGRIHVPMNFMKLVGFTTVPVDAQAIAENVSNLDIVIVYDESGSMNDDTYCYRGSSMAPCYIQGSNEYPAGERLYVPYADWIAEPKDPPLTYEGKEILVAEAEYFTYNTAFGEHTYVRDYYTFPGTFWIVQRVQGSQASGYRYTKDDQRGVHLMHQPHQGTIPGYKEAKATKEAPRLDYDFVAPASSPLPSKWYVWIRAQCGSFSGNSSRVDSCITHWGVDGKLRAGESTAYSDFGRRGGGEAGSDGDRWVWVRLGSLDLTTKRDFQINIWGGGSGFRLDKILVTRHGAGPETNTTTYPDRAPAFIRNTTPKWDNATRNAQYQTYERDRRYGGPADTGGRNGMALMKCNPIYGLRVNDGCTPGQEPSASCSDLDENGKVDFYEICDNTTDDMYDDQQPIRAAKEAAKNFSKRLRAHYDQLGFVGYSTQYNQDVLRELNCVKTPKSPPKMPDAPGIWDPETGPDNTWIWCYDNRLDPTGYDPSAKRNENTTHGSIFEAIEDMNADGWTNIADGMRIGMKVLSSDTGHYGRPNAIKVMILLTDGVANRWPGYSKCGSGSCCAEDLYKPNSGSNDENKAADCVIYYSQIANNNSIVVYTIGLGLGADGDLLQAAADETGGLYYFAPRAQDLDYIFQQIADQIFLRLVE